MNLRLHHLAPMLSFLLAVPTTSLVLALPALSLVLAVPATCWAQTTTDAPAEPDPWADDDDDDGGIIDVEVGSEEEGGDPEGSKQARDESDFDPDDVLDEWEEELAEQDPVDVSVLGKALRVPRVAGSAHTYDEEDLARFEDDDVQRFLSRETPGVYARGEDGYGLRPNIGMRGGTSDRSRKVALLEDGILFGPAPYSAPAAYFFPLTTRMVGLEVFKGASAIRHGPNTIGGAINFLTRRIPYGHEAGIDLAAGTESYGKGHAYYGYGTTHWGVLVEGVRLRSNGFKQIDGGNPKAGFDKMEFMAKARVNSDPNAPVYHEGQIKLGYSRERSNETYLGLSDEDFAATPNRRYLTTALDNMAFDRMQVEASYGLVVRDLLTMKTTVYRHDFVREWFKVNRFQPDALGGGAPAIKEILGDPSGSRAVFYDVLRGAADSTDAGVPPLGIGENDRRYVSQGVQNRQRWTLPTLGGLVEQNVQIGMRYHYDRVARYHTEDPYLVVGGRLVRAPGDQLLLRRDQGQANALALSAIDEISIWRFLISPGLRFEYIRTHYERDEVDGLTVVKGEQKVLLPGVGVVFQIFDGFNALAGVHQGFSPVAPGQTADVKPETSTNLEAGARLSTELLRVEAIGFLSLYDNLTGECTFSAACAEQDLNRQFNAGEARIAGLEAAIGADVPTPIELVFPVAATYTFTHTELLSDFSSAIPGFDEVQAGDRIPYVPEHQVGGRVGVMADGWGSFNVAMSYVSRMRETAGRGEADPADLTDAQFTIDLLAEATILPELSVYGSVLNLFNNSYIVSRRPFGARPGRPRFGQIGVKVLLDD